MEIKTFNPMKILVFSVETSMIEMMQYVRVKAKELSIEAITKCMEITGPIYWIYKGADGKPDTRFILDICLPVYCHQDYKGKFELRQFDSFKCVTSVHYGNWQEMGIVYNHLFGEIFANNLKLNGICREMYINIDFDNPENNITEIQVGVI
jgi:effector-binding domain-containing protein